MIDTSLEETPARDIELPGCTLTANGAVFSGDMSVSDWEEMGTFLSRTDAAVQWWIGDWLLYGEGRPEWGDKYEKATSLFNRDINTLKNIKSVAKRFELSRRHDNLTFQHHQEVATLPVESQNMLLDEASSETTGEPPMQTRQLRKRVREVQQSFYQTGSAELPDGVFDLILADPPWQYEFSKTGSRDIENHYPTMELDEICNLPIPRIAADDCVMFMWTTSPKLAESFQVIEAWSFTHRTNMVWVKDKIGMGYSARQRHEQLLICIKGTPRAPLESLRPDSVITAPRLRHSQKPEIVYGIVETMYPDSKRIELFSRQERPGWHAWGNEV